MISQMIVLSDKAEQRFIDHVPGSLTTEAAFRGLEPYDGKLSSTVLRGTGDGNVPRSTR